MSSKLFRKLAGDWPPERQDRELSKPAMQAALGPEYCKKRRSEISRQRVSLEKLVPSPCVYDAWYNHGQTYPPPHDRSESPLRYCRNFKRLGPDRPWVDSLIPSHHFGSSNQSWEKYLEREYGREVTDRPRYFTSESDSARAFISAAMFLDNGMEIVVERPFGAPEDEKSLVGEIRRYVASTFRCEQHPKGKEGCKACEANRFDWKQPPEVKPQQVQDEPPSDVAVMGA